MGIEDRQRSNISVIEAPPYPSKKESKAVENKYKQLLNFPENKQTKWLGHNVPGRYDQNSQLQDIVY